MFYGRVAIGEPFGLAPVQKIVRDAGFYGAHAFAVVLLAVAVELDVVTAQGIVKGQVLRVELAFGNDGFILH